MIFNKGFKHKSLQFTFFLSAFAKGLVHIGMAIRTMEILLCRSIFFLLRRKLLFKMLLHFKYFSIHIPKSFVGLVAISWNNTGIGAVVKERSRIVFAVDRIHNFLSVFDYIIIYIFIGIHNFFLLI